MLNLNKDDSYWHCLNLTVYSVYCLWNISRIALRSRAPHLSWCWNGNGHERTCFPPLHLLTDQLLRSSSRAEVAACWPPFFFISPFFLWSEAPGRQPLSNTHVCLVAEPLCAQLRWRQRWHERAACLPPGSPLSHINTSAGVSLAATPSPFAPPTTTTTTTLGSFSCKSYSSTCSPETRSLSPRGYKHFIEHVAAPRYSKPFPALPLAHGLWESPTSLRPTHSYGDWGV